MRVALLNHPDHIREVLSIKHRNFIKGRPLRMAKALLGEGLLTSEGDFHKRHSRIIQPAFHRKMVASYDTAVTEYTRRMMNRWEDGMQLDIFPEMIKMSTAAAGKAFFHADLETEAPDINEALNSAAGIFGRTAVPYSEWLLKLPLPGTFRFFKAKARLDEMIYHLIDKRRQHPIDQDDLLALLLRAQEKDKSLTDEQIRDEALTILLAGFDTTSLALTWTFYLLSQHPEVERALQEEVDRVLPGRIPTATDIPRLKYTRMVLGESMRILPPIYLIAREALEDFSIEQYTIPAGTLVLISPYLIHHDARFHPNPEQFDPKAWDKHANRKNSKYEYLPFGVGPRACIGQPFAWLEGILALATIVRHWKLQLVPGHPVAFLQLVNLRPKYGMRMVLERR